MNLALRIGEANLRVVETLPDTQHDRALDVGDALRRVLDPDAQVQVDRTVAELRDETNWLGPVEDAFHRPGSLETELDRLVQVGVVAHGDGNVQAYRVAIVGPVLDAVGDEIAVGDVVRDPIPRPDGNVAHAHMRYPPKALVVTNDVAGLDGLPQDESEACQKICHRLLQAEADADTDHAREDCKRG